MNKKRYLLFLPLALSQLYGVDFLSLERILKENSKQLELKKYDINISKEELNIVNSEIYPNLSVGINLENTKSLEDSLKSSSVGDNNLVTDTSRKSYSYVGINYNLYSFGRFDSKKRVQEYKTQAIKYSYCLEKKELSLKLLEIYSNALSYQTKIENFEKVIEKKTKIYNFKEKLHLVGNINKLEVTKTAIEIADLYSQITDYKKEMKTLIYQINFLINHKISEYERLEPLSISKIDEEMSFEQSINAKMIASEIEAKKSEVSLYEKEFFPNLNFYSKYDVYGYNQDSYRQSIEEMKENSYRFGLNLSINLFDGFKTSSLRQKAILELKQLQTKYDLERDKFEMQILTSNQNYEIDKLNQKNKIQNLQLALINNENTQKLQNIGELGKIDDLNADIEKDYKELDYRLNEGKLAYEYTKKSILLKDDECIVP